MSPLETGPAPSGTSSPQVLRIALISHTNAGKTSLARTLLRRDVGEVADQAHITDESSAYDLLSIPPGDGAHPDGGRIVLWDTPGFGDSLRLVKELEQHPEPLAWLASQEFDSRQDRAMRSSKRAVETVLDHADVVLYLVNAAEEPEGAGYVEPEMRLLGWSGRPVVALLNQAGPPTDPETRRRAEERWRWHLASHSAVRDVIHLDAFARCWVQEGLLLLRLQAFVPETRRALMGRLVDAWQQDNAAVMQGSIERLARLVVETAGDCEPVGEAVLERRARKLAAAELSQRLDTRTKAALDDLIALAGLSGQATLGAQGALEDIKIPGDRPDPRRMSLWGGVAGGALGGLAADLAHAGMTFGAGTVLGALAGGLGLGGFAWGFEQVLGERDPILTWSPAFLDRQVRDAVLRYMAIAHFGRGSGRFQERTRPVYWSAAAEAALRTRAREVRAIAKRVHAPPRPPQERLDEAAGELARVLNGVVSEMLASFYPGCERLLEPPRRPDGETRRALTP